MFFFSTAIRFIMARTEVHRKAYILLCFDGISFHIRIRSDKKAGENGIGFYCRKLIWEAYCLDSGICPADCRST